MKKVEKEVFADYEGDIRDMTITQGRILIKLIEIKMDADVFLSKVNQKGPEQLELSK